MMSRLGLQKRIMLYVTIGLVVMFTVFAYVGMQAVNRGVDLVVEERLAITQSVAAAMGRDFDHAISDLIEDTGGLRNDDHEEIVEATVNEAFQHLSEVDYFSFFIVTSVWLLGSGGEVLGVVRSSTDLSTQPQPTEPALHSVPENPVPQVLWPESYRPGQFVSVWVPVESPEGDLRYWAVAHTEAIGTSEPFVPFGLLGLESYPGSAKPDAVPRQSQYTVEVLSKEGTLILGIGIDLQGQIGQQSPHLPLLESLLRNEGSGVVREVRKSGQGPDHLVAVASVPFSDLSLILEQDADVALALPNDFRRMLMLLGGIGFIVALVTAWVTTRRVVGPTEDLTAAAIRMANGELSTPITIRAQDEIGVLAQNLETMRQQLSNALHEVESTNRDLESRVRGRTLQLNELVQRVFTAHEDERRRVALELHDETAQALTALTMTLDSVIRRKDDLTPLALERLREGRQIASDSLEGLRRMIFALRPVALDDMGLDAALRWHAEDLMGHMRTDVHVTKQGHETKLRDHVELAIYRIGQEAINNMARHADADDAWVTVEYRDSTLELTVRDDGKGFDPDNFPTNGSRTSGLGLAGMRERTNLVDGRLTIESAPGAGTVVRVEVPIGSGD